jgi:tRNA1(Val) A37 N6-methylase TrmN6
LRGPAPERRGAWLADEGLAAWTGFLNKAVREGGTITVIHRADRLADLLDLMSNKAGSLQVRPVHPFADAPAKRVIVRAVKTGKAPLRLLPPLVLHGRDGARHTPEAEAILRGEADLGWA